jgi:hypothetical protein
MAVATERLDVELVNPLPRRTVATVLAGPGRPGAPVYDPGAMGPRGTTLTRFSAALSLVALGIAALSDFLLTGFWDRNAMVTSVVADVLVLIVGVAVVNEFLAARARREWRLLADYGLVELCETARHIWGTLAQHIGVGRREALTLGELREVVRSREGEETVGALAREIAGDPSRRQDLHEVVAELADQARDRLGRWAPVLVGTPHPHTVTGFVELQVQLMRLQTVLLEDSRNWRPSYEGSGDSEWIASRIEAIIRLGSRIDLELLSAVEDPDRWGWGPHVRTAG